MINFIATENLHAELAAVYSDYKTFAGIRAVMTTKVLIEETPKSHFINL